MGNFLYKFDKEQEFNLFLGEKFNKLNNIPTKLDIINSIHIKINQYYKNYIKDKTSLSEISQSYLDTMILSKRNLLSHVSGLFSNIFYEEIEAYKLLIDSKKFKTVITLNYDMIFEKNFDTLVNKLTPFSEIDYVDERIKYYKIFGDFENLEKLVVTSQDIKRLKTLEIHKEFWLNLRKDLSKRPTFILGFNFEDEDFLNIFEYILDGIDYFDQTIYLVASNRVFDTDITRVINKYGIKILNIKEEDFIFEVSERQLSFDSGDVSKKCGW